MEFRKSGGIVDGRTLEPLMTSGFIDDVDQIDETKLCLNQSLCPWLKQKIGTIEGARYPVGSTTRFWIGNSAGSSGVLDEGIDGEHLSARCKTEEKTNQASKIISRVQHHREMVVERKQT